MKVFTLGYQGLSLEDYVATLVSVGVGVVLDVRETPWSYNRRYIKSVMANALAESGVKYVHLRACGNPSANRKAAKNVKECLEMYRIHLDENKLCLDELTTEIKYAYDIGAPACLTCFEKEPESCHRSVLLDELVKSEPTLEVVHLNVDKPFTRITVPLPASDTIALQL